MPTVSAMLPTHYFCVIQNMIYYYVVLVSPVTCGDYACIASTGCGVYNCLLKKHKGFVRRDL